MDENFRFYGTVLRGAKAELGDGIRWVLHTQAHWSDIPAAYAASTTCWVKDLASRAWSLR